MSSNAGAKNRYNDFVKPRLDEITEWRASLLTEAQIAENLGIGYSTLSKYKTEHIELLEAIKAGTVRMVADVEASLFKIAAGYEYMETTKEVITKAGNLIETKLKTMSKHLAPNVTAINSVLNNHMSDIYRQRQSIIIEDKNEALNEVLGKMTAAAEVIAKEDIDE